MKLTNTGKAAVLLNIGDGIEIAVGGTVDVDAKAWTALKANPVVAEWVSSGRLVEDGAEPEAEKPKAKKPPAPKDAE